MPATKQILSGQSRACAGEGAVVGTQTRRGSRELVIRDNVENGVATEMSPSSAAGHIFGLLIPDWGTSRAPL